MSGVYVLFAFVSKITQQKEEELSSCHLFLVYFLGVYSTYSRYTAELHVFF